MVLAFGGLVLLGMLVVWLLHQRELARRYQCRAALRSTCLVLNLYRERHAGELPLSFSALSNYTSPRLFVCAGSDKRAGSWTNTTDWMDYFYVRWPEVTEIYTNYPLMYDRRLSNHGGEGINVLLVDGLVSSMVAGKPDTFHGQFFWDEDAQWLRRFAREHPSVQIPMPEDIK